jgi:hypothetical protein
MIGQELRTRLQAFNFQPWMFVAKKEKLPKNKFAEIC